MLQSMGSQRVQHNLATELRSGEEMLIHLKLTIWGLVVAIWMDMDAPGKADFSVSGKVPPSGQQQSLNDHQPPPHLLPVRWKDSLWLPLLRVPMFYSWVAKT